ncbi:MAG: TonB-dependent receptor [Rhodothermia bacterium]|nr:MAG: TonB-dependent receptor [Rhodothermia bacterium]
MVSVRGRIVPWMLPWRLLVGVFVLTFIWPQYVVSAQSSSGKSSSGNSESKDSLWVITMPETVVTATRTPALLRDVPIPTRVLTASSMRQQGALRVSDFLAEQTGLTLTSDFGAGIQIQGFDSAYSLVLIDGEPVIGRTAGTLDLDRIPVADIIRIEIVEGPSSSLYGSEALAGVINIVTKSPREPAELTFEGRLESHETSSLSASATLSRASGGVRVQFTRLKTSGYDLSPDIIGLTAPSYDDQSVSTRATYNFLDNLVVDLSSRYSLQRQSNTIGFDQAGINFSFDEKARRIEWSISPKLSWRPLPGIRVITRFHATDFNTESDLLDAGGQSTIEFDHAYRKAELQVDFIPRSKHLFSVGGGAIRQTVAADRIAGGTRRNQNYYVFFEHRWFPSEHVEVNTSSRLDEHSDYSTRLSPKLALLVKLSKRLRLRASVGTGFKAPTFQQLYMDFTNPVAGYSVIGASDVSAVLDRELAAGQIDYFLSDPSQLTSIRPENSVAFNVSIQSEILPTVSLEIRGFHNNVHDLIETLPVATKPNGQNIFTYTNLNRIYTRGVAADLKWHLIPNISLSAGYQYLDAKDRDVVAGIEQGSVFTRAGGVDRRLTKNEYGGLFNRSKHSGNIRVQYRPNRSGFSVSLRGIYRSRYGFGDLNGNLILDDAREYVGGYSIWNTTMTLPINGLVIAQTGIRNLFAKTNPTFIPSLSGRLFFASISLRLNPNGITD